MATLIKKHIFTIVEMQTLKRNLAKYLEIVLHRLGQLFGKPLGYIIANQAETNKTFPYYN